MWNIRPIYWKNRGFTLIEIILALAISSMIIIPLVTILNYTIKTCISGEKMDELILNGRYAIEYVKTEIKLADKMIVSTKIEGLNGKYPTNLGFVIMTKKGDKEYNYITYYTRNGSLIRIACESEIEDYPAINYFDLKGHNTIAELIDNAEETRFSPKESMIFLDFELKHGNEDMRMKADIYIACPIEY